MRYKANHLGRDSHTYLEIPVLICVYVYTCIQAYIYIHNFMIVKVTCLRILNSLEEQKKGILLSRDNYIDILLFQF